MTETDRLDADDRALIARCERELLTLAAGIRADLHARRLARADAHRRRNYALMESDFGDREGARAQRTYGATARGDIFSLKAKVLTALREYRMTFKDITRARKDIGRRHTPAFDRPRWHLGGSVLSTRQIIEGEKP